MCLASLWECWLRTVILHPFSLEAEWNRLAVSSVSTGAPWVVEWSACPLEEGCWWPEEGGRSKSKQRFQAFSPTVSYPGTSVRGHHFSTKAASKWLCPSLLIIPGLFTLFLVAERIRLDCSSLCGQEAGHMTNFDCWVLLSGLGWENRASCIWHFSTRGVKILCSADKLSHANHTRFLGDWRRITWWWENVG